MFKPVENYLIYLVYRNFKNSKEAIEEGITIIVEQPQLLLGKRASNPPHEVISKWYFREEKKRTEFENRTYAPCRFSSWRRYAFLKLLHLRVQEKAQGAYCNQKKLQRACWGQKVGKGLLRHKWWNYEFGLHSYITLNRKNELVGEAFVKNSIHLFSTATSEWHKFANMMLNQY